MRGNPALPEGPLTSKPAWSNTSGCWTTPVFFPFGGANRSKPYGVAAQKMLGNKD